MKKLLGIFLTLALVLGMLPTAWGAYTYSGTGSGTEADPYVVPDTESLENRLLFAEDGSFIKLADNVSYGDVDVGSGAGVTEPPKNLTIIGVPTATVDFTVRSAFNITGWIFEGVNFAGDGMRITNDATADGITLNNCTFTEGAYLYFKAGSSDVTITNSTFNSTGQKGIYIQGAENVTVSNCTFENVTNAVNISSTGKVVVSENIIKNTTDRPIRFGDVDSNTKLTVNNNIMVNSQDKDGEIIKATSVAASATVNLESNYWGVKDLSAAVVNFTLPAIVGITGGTWDIDVTEYLAEGYKAAKNEAGVFVVEPVYVAAIGDKQFVSLQAAVDAAAAGDTIVLVDNVTVADTNGVSIAKKVTIDLNGKNVDFDGDGFVVEAGGDVTIKGEGNVTAGKTIGNWVAVWAKPKEATVQRGQATIQGGTWAMANVDKNGEGNTLIYSKGGDITVEGGYFNAENTFNNYGKPWYYVLNSNNDFDGIITVTGGTFEKYNPADGDDVVEGAIYLAAGYESLEKKEGEFTVYQHKLVAEEGTAPTCNEGGIAAHYTCEACGKLYSDAEGEEEVKATDLLLSANGHTVTKTEAKAATCTEAGHIAYDTCAVCKKTFVADGTGKTELKAEELVVKATGHTVTKTAAKAATCTEDGNVEYYTCSVCKKTFADAKGEKELAADKLVVKSEGHKIVKAAAKEATYTAEGNKEFYYCEVCKTAFADAEGKKTLTESEIKALVIPQLIKVDEDKAEVSEGAVDVAIEEAKKDKAEEVTLDLTHKDVVGEENVDAVTQAELPVAALEAVAEEEKALTLVKEDATVTLDVKALEAVAEQAKGEEIVTLKVESIKVEALADKQQAAVKNKEVAVVITAELLAGDKKIATKDGKGFGDGAVTVAVPVPAKLPEGVKAADLKVYFVDDDGTVSEVKSEVKDGKIVFTLTHFSEYVIAAEKPASPATGDNMSVALYGVLAIMAVMGMGVVLKKKAF